MRSIKYSIDLMMQINTEMTEKVNQYIDECLSKHIDINQEKLNEMVKYFRELKTDIANQFLNLN
jgi:hypothetical protein